jgi:hypothetical protein
VNFLDLSAACDRGIPSRSSDAAGSGRRDLSELGSHHGASDSTSCKARDIVVRRGGKRAEGRGGGMREEGADRRVSEERGDLHGGSVGVCEGSMSGGGRG